MKKKRKTNPKKAKSARRPVSRKARPKSSRRTRGRTAKRTRSRRATSGTIATASTVGLLEERLSHADSTPVLSGGDLDADWQRAGSSGEEAVGGGVPTPDQDVVDEIGRALGVEQGATAPVTTSDEILRDRDRRRWELERRADRKS